MDAVALVDQLQAPGALGVRHIGGRHPEIAPVGAGIFLGQDVRGVGTTDVLQFVIVRREAVVSGGVEIKVGGVADAAAVI